MKKSLTIILLLLSTFAFAQRKAVDSLYSNLRIYYYDHYNLEDKYPDTLKCFFLEYNHDLDHDRWVKGYIILIGGMIKTGYIRWSPKYAPMAIGFFDNKFLYEDKSNCPFKVLQLTLIK